MGCPVPSRDRADRITAAGSTSSTVNANGNMTTRGSDSFTDDQANRLKTATVGGTTTTNVYDGDGKRASQIVGSSTTSYVYDVGNGLPTVLSDGTRKYVYGLGLAYTVDSGNVVQVYQTDGLGSVRALTDGTGTVVQTYLTDAFGVPTATQGSSSQPFGYTGQQRDGDGLVYLRARFYDPGSGRFLSRDPFAGMTVAPQSLNRYSYVQNNPVNASDPSGHTPQRTPRKAKVLGSQSTVAGGPGSGQGCGPYSPEDPCIGEGGGGSEPAGEMGGETEGEAGGPRGGGDKETQPAEVNSFALSEPNPGRNPAQDRKLSDDDLRVLKNADVDVHELKKQYGRVSLFDLYKDTQGNIYVKRKGGAGEGDFTGINLYDLLPG